jgi:GNAT superfamily N-acetyltransferase
VVDVRLASRDELRVLFDIDDDSGQLYRTAGVVIDLPVTHPFIVDERARWTRSVEARRTLIAEVAGKAVGFAAVDLVDGAAYLDQLSVRFGAMRKGVGRRLVVEAARLGESLGKHEIWLTTYGHLPWNRPFYERMGFEVVPEGEWGAGVRHHVDAQRESLPLPEERVAMRAPLPLRPREP